MSRKRRAQEPPREQDQAATVGRHLVTVNRQLGQLATWATRTGPRIVRSLHDTRMTLDRLRSMVDAVERSRVAAETMRATAVTVAVEVGAAAPIAVPDPVGAVRAGIADPYTRALFDVVVDGRLDALVRLAITARD